MSKEMREYDSVKEIYIEALKLTVGHGLIER